MWSSESYTIASALLPRLLGMIYFFAIGAFLFQIKGLIGENGILPVKNYLNYFRIYFPNNYYTLIPTVFWWRSDDKALMGATILGVLISIVLMIGYMPSLCLVLLFIIHLSIVSVGQDFLSFGWESFLLELTFYTFLTTLTPIPNMMAWICLNFLLFRFHIQAGAVKLQSHDPNWRNLTAIGYHYQSQPLPNTQAWYVYKWPMWFHKASTLFMFFAELIVPFGLLMTQEVRLFAGILLIALQVIIWWTGNLSYLNHMTASFCVIALNDNFLSYFINPQARVFDQGSGHWIAHGLTASVSLIFIVLQGLRLWQHFKPLPSYFSAWLSRFSSFHLVNRYGLFAIMTTKRYEIIIEGSDDGVTWKEYLCWFKPSELTRRPRRISPFQPRIDWQMWFLPFDEFASATWFHQFLYEILKGNREVLKLLRYNPFPDQAPKYIRALAYDYQFSTSDQKERHGWWWQRELVGSFSPILSLKS